MSVNLIHRARGTNTVVASHGSSLNVGPVGLVASGGTSSHILITVPCQFVDLGLIGVGESDSSEVLIFSAI